MALSMEIADVRMVDIPPSPKGFQIIAMFSLDVTPEFRIYDCKAVRAPDGKINVYPPQLPGGFNTAAISPAARLEISYKIIEAINRDEHTSQRAA